MYIQISAKKTRKMTHQRNRFRQNPLKIGNLRNQKLVLSPKKNEDVTRKFRMYRTQIGICVLSGKLRISAEKIEGSGTTDQTGGCVKKLSAPANLSCCS